MTSHFAVGTLTDFLAKARLLDRDWVIGRYHRRCRLLTIVLYDSAVYWMRGQYMTLQNDMELAMYFFDKVTFPFYPTILCSACKTAVFNPKVATPDGVSVKE